MTKVKKIWLLVCVVLLLAMPSWAQFHSNGASPAGLRWRVVEGRNESVLAPDYAEPLAHKVLYLMDSLTTTIGYGLLPHKEVMPLRMPVVMHTENSASNGISIMAPRRIEMGAMPATESYATPWLRQLSVHEYRHAAQYGALFDGPSQWLYYLLGDQVLLAATGVMPFWWLEGDAVDAETQASLFGRGLQPSFTMHYRAVGRRILEGANHDKWFGGSYNEYIPSHYNLGYQMVTTANAQRGEYAWGEIMDYARKHPYTITPFEWAMRKRWGMTTADLFVQTFERLNDLWESLPEREDSARRVPERVKGSPYRLTRYPVWVSEDRVVAVVSSFDEASAFVEIDVESGARRVLHHIGAINTRPVLIGDHLYWTEMQQISSFAQQIGSVLLRARVDGKGVTERVLSRGIYALYPGEYGGDVAYVRYDFTGTYTVVCTEGDFVLPEGVECHGLAADGDHLYLITTSDRGMAIEHLVPESGTWQTIKKPTRATLSSLVADGGKLYFGSIASGYDEIHSIDLATGVEERLTTSRYGSFYGAPSPDGERLAVAIYDAEGYHLAVGDMRSQERVAQSIMPRNVVNPERFVWNDVVCIDTLRYGTLQARQMRAKSPSKPYNKASGAINIHSWAPIYYRPDQLMSGNLDDVRFGATVVSQSLLSDAISSLGLFVMPSGDVGANLNLKYIGWAPKLEMNVRTSTASAGYYAPVGVMMRGGDYYASYDHSEQVAPPTVPQNSFSLSGRIHLPMVLSNGYVTTTLTPAVEYSFANNTLYSPTTESYHNGMHAVAATLQWNSNTRMAYRNLNPRWGAAFVAGVGRSLAPFQTPTTWGAFARFYTPAFGANDGFTLRASYQDIAGSGPLGYALNFGWLIPRGQRTSIYPDDMIGGSVQYDTPVCYPDWGVSGIVMIKRVRALLFVDTLWGRMWMEDGSRRWGDATTFGGDIYVDTSWLRLPEEGDLTIKLGLYFDTCAFTKPTFTGGLALNF